MPSSYQNTVSNGSSTQSNTQSSQILPQQTSLPLSNSILFVSQYYNLSSNTVSIPSNGSNAIDYSMFA